MNNKSFFLEEKDIYKLFNVVKFDQSEFDQMDDEMPEILKKKIKKNINKKIWKRSYIKIAKGSSIAAAILLVILIGVGIASPALAKNIPIINSITQMLNDKVGFHGEYTSYSQLVDKSVTDHGIMVTINEAMADDTKIILGYTFKSDSKIENKDLLLGNLFMATKVNGSNLRGGGARGEFIDDFTYSGSGEFKYDASSFSDNLKVDINVNEILGVGGNWDFSFTVSKDELINNSTVFNTNVKVDLPDQVNTIEKVVLSPIDTTIFYNGVFKEDINQKGFMPMYSWIVFDDQGVELAPKSSSQTGMDPFTGSIQFERTNGTPHYLTVIPYIDILYNVKVDPNDQKTKVGEIIKIPSESRVLDGKFPFELSQGKMGKLIIKNIVTENGETVIRYTAEGKAPYHQGMSFYIRDASGETVAAKNYDIRRDAAHPNEFTKIYPLLDLSKGYSVSTSKFENEKLLEECKVTIELKQ